MSRKIEKDILLGLLFACFFVHAVGGDLYGESRRDVNGGCQDFLAEVKKRNKNTTPGTINQAGLYKNVKKISLKNVVEANHIPPKSCTEAVKLYNNKENYVALSTEYDVHRRAGSTNSQHVRHQITEYLENGNIVGALEYQIVEDYICTNSFEEYKTGLIDAIAMLACLNRTDGEPILSRQEHEAMEMFLTGEPIPQVTDHIDYNSVPICSETREYQDHDEL